MALLPAPNPSLVRLCLQVLAVGVVGWVALANVSIATSFASLAPLGNPTWPNIALGTPSGDLRAAGSNLLVAGPGRSPACMPAMIWATSSRLADAALTCSSLH